MTAFGPAPKPLDVWVARSEPHGWRDVPTPPSGQLQAVEPYIRYHWPTHPGDAMRAELASDVHGHPLWVAYLAERDERERRAVALLWGPIPWWAPAQER